MGLSLLRAPTFALPVTLNVSHAILLILIVHPAPFRAATRLTFIISNACQPVLTVLSLLPIPTSALLATPSASFVTLPAPTAPPALFQAQIRRTSITQHVYLPVPMALFPPLLPIPARLVTLNASSAIQQAPIAHLAPSLAATKHIFIIWHALAPAQLGLSPQTTPMSALLAI